MQSWDEFENEAPEFARAARRLFTGADGVAIGFLATASRSASPHISPVCPIFSADRLFLSAASGTPKVRDLLESSRYALHAFLGPSDEEFQLRGSATEVTSPAEREVVHDAIAFGSFDPNHPVFELSIASALWVYWQNAGQPDTRAVRKSWPHDARAV